MRDKGPVNQKLDSATIKAEAYKMLDQKIPENEIARRLGVSPPYISKLKKKRLTQLEPEPPLLIDNFPPEKRHFCVESASGVSGTEAYCRSYDTANRNSAKTMASRLLKDGEVRAAIQELLDREVPLKKLIGKLSRHVDSRDSSVSLRATEMGLKLHDAFPGEKRRNFNINTEMSFSPVDLSEFKNCDPDEDCDSCSYVSTCKKNKSK